MSHTERENVPDGGTDERKGALSLRQFGIRNTRLSAEERIVRDGMYSTRRSER